MAAADPAAMRPVRGAVWVPLSRAGVTAALLVLAARLLVPGLLDRVTIPVAVIGILLGVPHGAVDHLVPFWSTGRRISARALAAVLAGYLTIAGCAALALALAPTAAVAAFLIASAVHFGRAEVEFVAARTGRREPASTERLRAAAHGGTVVAVPLALWHHRVAPFLHQLAPALTSTTATVVLAAVAVTACLLTLVLLGVDARQGRHDEAAEALLVLLLVAVVPPLPAFAVYFGAWHALRHTARLVSLPGPGGRPLPVAASVRRYLVHAAVPTLTVAVGLAVVVALGDRAVVSSALLVLVALTFPHMRTVAELDRTVRAR